jgi:hypothetical protein
MVQILKHLGISKRYDLDRHTLRALEEKRNYSRVDNISIEINTLVPRY